MLQSSPSPTPDPSEALLSHSKLNLPSNIQIKNPPQPSSSFHFSSSLACSLIINRICIPFLLLPSPSHPTALETPIQHIARPLQKLKKPVIILISSDGFRFGYQYKTDTPNIHRLINNGTEAEMGLIPVFPTLTFPNHYSIVTGLYLNHGVINNRFTDPISGEGFTMQSKEPKWWLGEPIWETIVNKGSWNCDSKYCKHYNSSVPFEDRVDSVLEYFDLPSDELPSLMTLYFEDPDHQGHLVGPDDPEITKAVAHIDSLIVFLDDLAKWVKVRKNGFNRILGLGSGKVKNGMNLKVYLKEDLPKRLHYASYRIPPIVGWLENYKVEQTNVKRQECGGAHGYDNAFFSMRTIFIGHGPQFARGCKVPSFENVQIYNLLTSILKIKGAPNNGSSTFVDSILLNESR
ncbi:hypothetical protein MKW92_041231 [Papaver armeniacum]|nr:hypothetical protein MKW92_041231 [Papaver armeniacum]